MLNKQRYISQTPGCHHRKHLNNAGSSLSPQPVIDAIQNYFDLEHQIGGYELMTLHESENNQFYESAAQLFNCKTSNIAFGQHSTEGLNKALLSTPFKEGDYILTTEDDYYSYQMAFLQMAKKFGTRLIRTESLPEGGYDHESMEKMIVKYRPKMVCVAHVPTNSGLVQDVEFVGELCEKYGAIYVIDACQSVGQMPLDVQKYKCHFLCTSTRKWLRGPRGAGILYVADEILDKGYEPLFLDGWGSTWTSPNTYETLDTARRFETFERSYALMAGSRAACDYALEIGLDNIEKEVLELANYTRSELNNLSNALITDVGKNLCGIVTVHLKGQNPDVVLAKLLDKNINTSITRKGQALIDFTKKGVDWSLRISPHYYNTKEEIDATMEVLKKL